MLKHYGDLQSMHIYNTNTFLFLLIKISDQLCCVYLMQTPSSRGRQSVRPTLYPSTVCAHTSLSLLTYLTDSSLFLGFSTGILQTFYRHDLTLTSGFTPCMQEPDPAGPAGLSGLCRVTEHLYLSNARAAADPSQLTRCRITCIVTVTETGSSRPPPPGVEHVHIPVSDSPVSPLCEHFDAVADKVQRTAELGGRTLLHCKAGVSRSAALCLAYLMKHRGASLLEAHGLVKSCRPMVRPNNGFWEQLVRYEMELRGCNSVRMVSSSMGQIPDVYEEEARNMVPL